MPTLWAWYIRRRERVADTPADARVPDAVASICLNRRVEASSRIERSTGLGDPIRGHARNGGFDGGDVQASESIRSTAHSASPSTQARRLDQRDARRSPSPPPQRRRRTPNRSTTRRGPSGRSWRRTSWAAPPPSLRRPRSSRKGSPRHRQRSPPSPGPPRRATCACSSDADETSRVPAATRLAAHGDRRQEMHRPAGTRTSMPIGAHRGGIVCVVRCRDSVLSLIHGRA